MWLQVIAAIISGASLQGVVGPGSSPPFACLSYGNFWSGGGLGFVSKYKPKDGSLGGAFNCSAIEFSVLKQPKHRNDMYSPASMHMVIMRKTYFRDIVVIAQWLAPIMMHMLQVRRLACSVSNRVLCSLSAAAEALYCGQASRGHRLKDHHIFFSAVATHSA